MQVSRMIYLDVLCFGIVLFVIVYVMVIFSGITPTKRGRFPLRGNRRSGLGLARLAHARRHARSTCDTFV